MTFVIILFTFVSSIVLMFALWQKRFKKLFVYKLIGGDWRVRFVCNVRSTDNLNLILC